jgi:hypothetical protein
MRQASTKGAYHMEELLRKWLRDIIAAKSAMSEAEDFDRNAYDELTTEEMEITQKLAAIKDRRSGAKKELQVSLPPPVKKELIFGAGTHGTQGTAGGQKQQSADDLMRQMDKNFNQGTQRSVDQGGGQNGGKGGPG